MIRIAKNDFGYIIYHRGVRVGRIADERQGALKKSLGTWKVEQ